MSLEKASGIVIETKESGEADSLVTLLLETGFKETFLFKGIRKSKKRTQVSQEIATLIHLVYYYKKNKEIFSVKEIEVIQRFEKIKSSYEGFFLISAIVDLVNKFIPKNLEQKKVFELLYRALETLNELGPSKLALPFFKLRFLQVLGYAPTEFECVSCSQDIFQKSGAVIYPSSLEIYCNDCKSTSENHLDILHFMKKMTHLNYRKLLSESVAMEIPKQVDSILNQFISFQLGYELKSQIFF